MIYVTTPIVEINPKNVLVLSPQKRRITLFEENPKKI